MTTLSVYTVQHIVDSFMYFFFFKSLLLFKVYKENNSDLEQKSKLENVIPILNHQ